MSKHGESENEYLFKVNLKRRRSIWRTVLLRGDQTLDELHEAIFAAFDRYDEHLYCFYFPKARQGRLASGKPPKEYRSPRGFDRTEVFEIDNRYNAARARLDDLRLKVGQTFEYLSTSGMSGGTRSSCKGSDQVNLVERTRESLKNDCHLRHNTPRATSDPR